MIISAQSFAIFAAVFLSLAASARADVAVRTLLRPNAIAAGQRAELDVRIDAEKLREEANRRGGNFQSLEDLTGALDKNDDLLLRSEKIRVLDEVFEKIEADLVWRYSLSVYEPGTYRIPPIEIKVGSLTLSSDSVSFTVQTTRAEGDAEMRPNFGEDRPPFPWTWIFYTVWLAAVLFLLSRMFELRATEPDSEFSETPEQWLQRRLTEIEIHLRSEDSPDAAIDAIGYAVREYLTRRTGYSVIGWTTVELARSTLFGAATSAAHQWLVEADLHKFARVPLDTSDFVGRGFAAAQLLLDRHRELC